MKKGKKKTGGGLFHLTLVVLMERDKAAPVSLREISEGAAQGNLTYCDGVLRDGSGQALATAVDAGSYRAEIWE